MAMTMKLWWDSYKNHILHCSIYLVTLNYVFDSASFWNDEDESFSVKGAACILVSALFVFLLYGEINYVIKRRHLPPGDSGYPIIGHLLEQFADPETFLSNHELKYGSMNTFNLMMIPNVIVSEDEDANWVLTQERKGNSKAFILEYLQKLLGTESIMLKSGDDHRRLRKIFEPAFTPLAIKDYAETIDQVAQETLEEWSKTGEFMPPRSWAILTMKVFFVCAFGVVNEELLAELVRLFEGWLKGFESVIPIALPGTAYAKGLVFKDKLGDILKNMILDFKTKNPPDSKAATSSVMGRLCYSVDDNGNPPTEDQLVDNLRFFLFAGFDTTKGSFGAITHFIMQNQEVYKLLTDEANAFAEPMDYDALKKNAPILNAVMAETWRMTSPLNSHVNLTTKTLYYKDYVFPKDVIIGMNIQGHNAINETRYPNAKQFQIERWLPEDHPLYDPKLATGVDYNGMNCKYRPFNAGSHACLGAHFAKLEVRIIMARLLQSYDIEIRNEQHIKFPLKQRVNEFKLTKR